MKKLYGLYRYYYTNTWVRYTPSYFFNKQFEDYIKAWVVRLFDWAIPDDRYTWELAPGIKKKDRFAYAEYDETKITENELKWFINYIGWQFVIRFFNNTTEAIQWLKANTDLKVVEEQTDGNGNPIYAKFEINPPVSEWNYTSEGTYLIID